MVMCIDRLVLTFLLLYTCVCVRTYGYVCVCEYNGEEGKNRSSVFKSFRVC